MLSGDVFPILCLFPRRFWSKQAVDINFVLRPHIHMPIYNGRDIESKREPGPVTRRILLTVVKQPRHIESVKGIQHVGVAGVSMPPSTAPKAHRLVSRSLRRSGLRRYLEDENRLPP